MGVPRGSVNAYSVPMGHIQYTSTNVATGAGAFNLTRATIPTSASRTKADFVVIQCEGSYVRWRDDGVAPTTSVGMLINTGDILIYSGNLDNLQLIRSDTSVKLNLAFFAGG